MCACFQLSTTRGGGNVKKQCQSLEILRWKAGYWGTTVQARTLSCVYSCLCSCWAAATYFVYLQKLASSRNLRTTQTRHEAGKWWTVGACRCFVWSPLGSKPVQCRGAPARSNQEHCTLDSDFSVLRC